jgi:hypothetical protein
MENPSHRAGGAEKARNISPIAWLMTSGGTATVMVTSSEGCYRSAAAIFRIDHTVGTYSSAPRSFLSPQSRKLTIDIPAPRLTLPNPGPL